MRSTVLYSCNTSGMHDVNHAIKFGIVVYDWSNGKAIWASQVVSDEFYLDIIDSVRALNSVIKVSFNLGVLLVGAAPCRPSKERCHFHRNKVPALIVRCCFRRCCCCCCCCRRCHPHTWPSSSAVMVEEVRHVKRHQHVCVQLVFSVFSPPSHRA